MAQKKMFFEVEKSSEKFRVEPIGYIKIEETKYPSNPAAHPDSIYQMFREEFSGKTFEVYSDNDKILMRPADAFEFYPTRHAEVHGVNMHNLHLDIGGSVVSFWRTDSNRPLSLTSDEGLVQEVFEEVKDKAA